MSGLPPSLVIGHAWNGEALSPEHQVRIRFEQSEQDLFIAFDAPFQSDAPPAGPPGSTWALWEHEVVEIFLVGETGRYLELEFGPHGHYLALGLSGPRQIESKHLPVSYDARLVSNRWLGEARILSEILPKRLSRLNAFSISGQGDARQYRVWHPLPGLKPDFHQPQSFPLI